MSYRCTDDITAPGSVREYDALSPEDAAERYAVDVAGLTIGDEVNIYVESDTGWVRVLVAVDLRSWEVETIEGDPMAEAKAKLAEAAAAIEPPEDCWVRIGDHDWATDGGCAVRRDSPRPASMAQADSSITRWYDDMTAAQLRKVMGSPSADVHRGWFDPRFAPLLAGGDVRASVESDVPSLGVAIVLRDGEPVAYVMPRRSGPGIRADGGDA